MKGYEPQDGLHICMLTQRLADEHTRRVYNVPDGVRLGWKPYTILITSYGGVAYKAFHSVADLRRWLGRDYRVRLGGGFGTGGIRSGKIVAK
jgi:hypothetical protein